LPLILLCVKIISGGQIFPVKQLIDSKGYRANVGIILCNTEGQVFWARRYRQKAWQFPQGGIHKGETPEQALFRELGEETGLQPEHVSIMASTSNWLKYRLPEKFIRYDRRPLCIGQKQRWFLLRMEGADRDVCLDTCNRPEFDQWRWVDYWHPLNEVIDFKREVYEQALNEFSSLLFPKDLRA
jgi:putative (di)nucleoside polyphosphate hydrolase